MRPCRAGPWTAANAQTRCTGVGKAAAGVLGRSFRHSRSGSLAMFAAIRRASSRVMFGFLPSLKSCPNPHCCDAKDERREGWRECQS